MRSEFHSDSSKILVIESRFLAVGLTGPDAPPCCVSIALDVPNETILDWRLFNVSSLAKATVLALDSMFDKASDTDPRELRVGHRYRYGHSEYVVTAVRDDRAWLQRADSPPQEATELDSQATSRPHRRALLTRTFITRAGAPAKVKEQRPNPLKHRRLDRQPEAIQRLILQEVRSSYGVRGLSKQSLVKNIVCHITRLNESRASNEEQFKVPSFTTLHRLIREIHEHLKHPL